MWNPKCPTAPAKTAHCKSDSRLLLKVGADTHCFNLANFFNSVPVFYPFFCSQTCSVGVFSTIAYSGNAATETILLSVAKLSFLKQGISETKLEIKIK